jgi:hypothetical protein
MTASPPKDWLEAARARCKKAFAFEGRDMATLDRALTALQAADALVANIVAGSPGGTYDTTRLVTAYLAARHGEPQPAPAMSAKVREALLDAVSGAPVGLLEPGCADMPRCQRGRALDGDRVHAVACPLAGAE